MADTSTERQVRLSDASGAAVLAQAVLDKHRESSLYKLALSGEWLLNQAFLQNKQWVVFDRNTQQVRDAKNPNNEQRHTENLVTPYTMSVVQLLNSGRPNMSLVPARSIEVEDEQAADVSQTVLEYVDKVTDWDRLTTEMNWWRATLGTAFMRFWLDGEAGQKVTLPVTNPETGGQDQVEIQEGEMRAESFSPWDVHLFPTTAASPRHVVATQFVSVMPVEDAQEKWPEYKDKIVADGELNPYDFNKKRVEQLTSPLALSSNYPASQGLVRVIEHIEAPTKKMPQGRKLVVVGRLLVENTVNPFADMFEKEAPAYLKMGWVCFRFIPVPGRVWGRGAPEDMRSMQIRLNELVTDIRRHRKANLRARIFVPDGSGVDKITNAMDGVYKYTPRPGMPPITVQQPISLGQAPYLEINEIKAGMGETSMRPEVSRGINAAQVRSAEQYNALLDQANQPFGIIAHDTELGYADCARLKMAGAKTWYSNLKLMRIVGEQKGFAVPVIRRENLYTDVTVVPGSALPRNAAAWNQMLTQMIPLLSAGGGPNAMRNINAIIEQLDLGGSKFEKPEQADIDRQDTELQQLTMGQWVQPQPWDNHIVHVDRCDRYLKKRPNIGPLAQKMIEMHQMQHHLFMARAAMPPMPAMMGTPERVGTETTGDRLQQAAATDQKRRMDVMRRQQKTQPQGATA